MMDFSVVTKGLQELLKNNANLQGFRVTRNEYVNEDPGLDKWVGIYKGKVIYTPQTLGRNNNYKTRFTIKVIVQAYGVVHTTDIDEVLEQRIAYVMDVVNADPRINGTVDMVLGYEVDYEYSTQEDESMPFQLAMITISMEKRA